MAGQIQFRNTGIGVSEKPIRRVEYNSERWNEKDLGLLRDDDLGEAFLLFDPLYGAGLALLVLADVVALEAGLERLVLEGLLASSNRIDVA